LFIEFLTLKIHQVLGGDNRKLYPVVADGTKPETTMITKTRNQMAKPVKPKTIKNSADKNITYLSLDFTVL
jgi:hypothetical protein